MNGILLVDKPSGWTSNDVVSKLRGVLHEKRVGHSGTLDPLATGLLLVFVGRATRAVEYSMKHPKTYEAEFLLGTATDTQDISGNVTAVSDYRPGTDELMSCVKSFRGDISQIPPMYSAIKKNGRKLYEIARAGGTVERAPRDIRIDEIRADVIDEDYVNLYVECSSGPYIRTLCNDIGEKLGCGACMTALRRTKVGEFSVNDAIRLEDLIAMSPEEASLHLVRTDSLFSNYPEYYVNLDAERVIRYGNPVTLDCEDGFYRVYSENGVFLMLGRCENGTMFIEKSFYEV